MRHDLNADGNIIKTISKKGIGYDRPSSFDELTVSIKAYQGNEVFIDITNFVANYNVKPSVLTPVIKSILESMKTQEVT